MALHALRARVASRVTSPRFDYSTAFDRNIGWLTEVEQRSLRHKKVAIAGMGGVGGYYLTTLGRLGVGKFHIADLDTFELANFNRQYGAFMSTLGRQKVEVLAEMAADINPDCEIETFPTGVNDENLQRFFQGVDVYLDGLDAFVPDLRVVRVPGASHWIVHERPALVIAEIERELAR